MKETGNRTSHYYINSSLHSNNEKSFPSSILQFQTYSLTWGLGEQREVKTFPTLLAHCGGEVQGGNPSASKKRELWSAELACSSLLPLHSTQKGTIQALSVWVPHRFPMWVIFRMILILFLMWVFRRREERGPFPLLWQTFCAIDSVHYSTTVKLSDILPLVQPQQSTASLLSSTYFTGFAVNLSG